MESFEASADLLRKIARDSLRAKHEAAKKAKEEVDAKKLNESEAAPKKIDKDQAAGKDQAAAKEADKSSSGQSFAEILFETQPTYFKRSQFDEAMKGGEKFMFGSATSAFQIEGGRRREKEDSIWDIFAEKKGFFNKYGEDAVDHHRHFKDDVGIMKEIGFNAYRFSISWSRIIQGGKRSQKGIDFYRGLLQDLRDNGISPFVTLYHWDTPAAFQTKDFPGFLDRRIAEKFGEYAQICFEAFGDLVENWITLNEPYTCAILSYVANIHAPGFGTVNMGDLYETGTNKENKGSRSAGHRSQPEKTEEEKKKEQIFELPSDENLKDTNAYPYKATHNMLLAHGVAVQKFREYQTDTKFEATRLKNQKIGITLVSMWFEPYNPYDKLDEKAAMRALDFFLGWYLDPLVHGEYPKSMRLKVENAEKHLKMTDEDRKLIHGSYDFIGVNYYTARYVRYKVSKPKHLKGGRNYVSDQHLKYYEKCKLKCGRMRSIGKAKGASAWLISYPRGMQKLLKHIKDKYDDPIMYVTENGIDDHDDDSKKDWGSLFDHKRLTYIRDHLYYIRKAMIEDKVTVKGYFVWSLLDNFEWNNNFDVRFGITYVNFKDEGRKRHLKLSAAWLQYFLAGREKQEVTTEKLDDDIPSESDNSSDDERN